MSDNARKVVDHIEKGQWNDAKEVAFNGIKQKAADAVDMKRVEKQVDWMDNPTTEGDDSE
jgi:hypothetical protein